MKKTSCVVLALLVYACCMIPAGAREVETESCHYVSQYYLNFCGEYFGGIPDKLEIGEYYEELYEYIAQPDSEDLSWALVRACHSAEPAYPTIYKFFCPDRYLFQESLNDPFKSDYGVYDIKNDEWMDLSVALNSEKYKGLTEACNENKIGRIYGDMDSDYIITIVDATWIQRYLASMTGDAWWQELSADYDRNGAADVLDATHIQKHLAGME